MGKSKIAFDEPVTTKYLHLPKNILGLKYKLNLTVVAYACSYVWSLNHHYMVRMKVGLYNACGNINILNHCAAAGNINCW